MAIWMDEPHGSELPKVTSVYLETAEPTLIGIQQ